jgi:uncharacterized protein YbjT (DUF2867 family)
MNDPIVVLGASGRVGRHVVDLLLAGGRPVRAVTRTPATLARVAAAGADVQVGPLDDADFLTGVLTGAASAYLLTPLDLRAADVNGTQRRNVDTMLAAVRRSGLTHAVLLSSWGAELSHPVSGVIGCHWFEQGLRAVDGLHAVHLRPVWFMENFALGTGLMRVAGINGLAIEPEVRFPMVATADIAAVAAGHLLDPAFVGHRVRYLNGPRAHTMVEATGIIGRAIGRPGLRYVRLPDGVLHRGLTGAGGLSPDAADRFIEINHAISSGEVHTEPDAADEPAAPTPTALDEVAATSVAEAYRRQPPPGARARLGGLALRSYLAVSGHRAA